MGIEQSTLKASTVRPLVRPDSLTPLPSFALDSAKFADGSVGFLVTRVDLAKNVTTQPIGLKLCLRPNDTTLLFVGTDDTLLTFFVDLTTKKVFCKVESHSLSSPLLRPCVTTYERLEEAQIDVLQTLYQTGSGLS